MLNSIAFYAAEQDYEALLDFIRQLGLILVSASFDRDAAEDPGEMPFCYLSVIPKNALHPYGQHRLVGYATDPLISFMRPYHRAPYLVLGHFQWSSSAGEFSQRTKPYYQKLAAWVKKRCTLLPGGDIYIGPHAAELAKNGAEFVNVLPGAATVTMKTVS